MRTPNLFIIGAPKCGTTSLAGWLAEHPSVFISAMKEPHYFSQPCVPQYRKRHKDMTFEDYERLFADATPAHDFVGEASTSYLLHGSSVLPKILEYSPDARFLVCVRNPIEMAFSLHQERLFNNEEDVDNFVAAWALLERRRQGQCVPRWAIDPKLGDYHLACLLGTQLQTAQTLIEPSKMKVLILDDMRVSPLRSYKDVLTFLGLPYDGRTEFPVMNARKHRRWPIVHKAQTALARAKRQIGIQRSFGALKIVDQVNRAKGKISAVDPRAADLLRTAFREDIERLGALLKRDFSHWLESPGT
jgi:hypothetical protein